MKSVNGMGKTVNFNMRNFRTIALLAVLMFHSFCWGQWQSAQGPEGGDIRMLFGSSQGYLYAASTELLFRRHQDSVTWSSVKAPMGNYPIYTMHEHNGKLYASIGTNGNIPSLYARNFNQDNWDPLTISNTGDVRVFSFNTSGQLIIAARDRVLISDGGQSTQQVEVAAGAFIRALICLKSGTLLAGTAIGLFSSEDEGSTWSAFNQGLADSIPIMKLHQGPYGEIALITEMGELYIADSLQSDFVQSLAGLENESIQSFTYDNLGNRYCGSANGHLFRSAGDAQSWDRVFTASDPRSIWHLVSLGQNEVVFAPSRDGLYLYRDDNQSLTQDINGLVASEIRATIILNEDELLVSTNHGLYRYHMDRQEWVEIKFDGNSWPTRCLKLAADGKLLACSGSGLIGVTIDGSIGQLERLGLDSISTIFIEEDTEGYIYTADWQRGLFKGKPNEGWIDIRNEAMKTSIIQSMAITKDDDLYVGTQRALWKRSVGSSEWELLIDDAASMQGFILDDQEAIFALAFPGIYRSIDAGISWTIHQVSPDRPVRTLISLGANRLLAGLERDGLYSSYDQGTTWHRFSEEIPVSTINTLLTEGNRWFAGTSGGGLYWLDQKSTSTQTSTSRHQSLVYPNPARQRIHIKSANFTLARQGIQIYDLHGRIVKSELISAREQGGITPIDISQLDAGIYFVAVGCGESMIYDKLVKVN